ncbi:MAG: hypothetical protein ACI8ZB_005278, partial [Desulforhopalus sp.]
QDLLSTDTANCTTIYVFQKSKQNHVKEKITVLLINYSE